MSTKNANLQWAFIVIAGLAVTAAGYSGMVFGASLIVIVGGGLLSACGLMTALYGLLCA